MSLVAYPDHTLQRPAYLVFTDVDETLITRKSMFDFLQFQLTRRYGDEGEARYRLVLERLRAQAAAGSPREDVNRAYYRLYAGEDVAEMSALGEQWFAERSAEPDFFIPSTVSALLRHRAAGAELALVSGSFAPCLAPIARRVGAAYTLGTEALVEAGRYTGEVRRPMIGAAKRAAVLDLIAAHRGIEAADCFAFGDHLSDLPMLECVGHPRVVGGDPELIRQLDRRPATVPGCAVACWSMGAEACDHECL
ncbi:HAD superfamily hydrolase (TIGR01490 family) [Kitasatospora cineracea]|uniref:HAD superfamily hydrolase (TIGR01490 family) n=1 Tax=Kitasatospora cineracea TaxID=88074 RepID=A0A3N4R0A0_9ACTN|nr:HAD-IB family hydrolase [Kitasatospora cineracea]ROR33997.1 HAD superfamily hydrolase (TIGR01490 family) [Kitasatospora cineracea]RPE26993.1 HAD superfamily hydrolase (TIGR01490 family) [Kitasatospora cineracea]